MMKFQQTHISLYSPHLPDGLDGLELLHISDLHLRDFGPREHRLREIIAEGCDLLLCSGDICHQPFMGNPFHNATKTKDQCKPGLSRHGWVFMPRKEEAVKYFSRLIQGANTRLGAFIVQGNHDPDDVMERLNPADMTVLHNQSRLIETPAGGRLNLCGLRCGTRGTVDIPQTFLQLQEGCFTIALTHYPEIAEALAGGGADLILAGHTHGGQICLPGGRPLITHSRTGSQYVAGLERIGHSWIYVNRGLNATLIPIRTFCPAEVVRICLHRGAHDKTTLTTTF